MGKTPRDRLRDFGKKATDKLADETGKRKTGMDPSVCEGCPHRGDAPLFQCGLCGCPTLSNAPLAKFGMTPAKCPRARAHARATGDPHNFLADQ